MPNSTFDRSQIKFKSLSFRKNKVKIETDHIPVTQKPFKTSDTFEKVIELTVKKLKSARKKNASRMLVFGAHAVKNGLAPLMIQLIRQGWITHLATNGAGIIHDWEFAYQGESSEDVKSNVSKGEFGIWQETGFYLNLALLIGAYEGKGYGESIGSLIARDGLEIPEISYLKEFARSRMDDNPDKAAAAIDLAGVIKKFKIKPGWFPVEHPFKKYSIQSEAFKLKVPFTSHPMFGHDIIYAHPVNHGAALGRTAEKDFLCFAESVKNLENGVYLSIGSAVMSPMVFEKSLSMSQNVLLQKDRRIKNHFMLIVDLAESSWDWEKNGEPPSHNPAYYLRYCKTFSRMGGEMQYLSADNRDFLLALYQNLKKTE